MSSVNAWHRTTLVRLTLEGVAGVEIYSCFPIDGEMRRSIEGRWRSRIVLWDFSIHHLRAKPLEGVFDLLAWLFLELIGPEVEERQALSGRSVQPTPRRTMRCSSEDEAHSDCGGDFGGWLVPAASSGV